MIEIPNLTNITRDKLLELVSATEELKNKFKYRQLDFLFTDTGEFNRFKYPRALEFFKAGKDHLLRMFSAPNGYGKSFALFYELSLHVTGEYPDWWEGCRQENPRQWWIIVPSAELFQSSSQRLLMGNSLMDEDIGTGFIPKERIVDYSGWPSVSGAVRSIKVRHKKGHIVTLEVKSSKQDREDIQAANLDGVLEDEEPDIQIHGEALFRLRPGANKPTGLLMLGYSPINGLTDLTLQWMPHGIPPKGEHPDDPNKYVVHLSGAEKPPHVTDAWRKIALANCPPHLIAARLDGLPGIGAGKIYPFLESQVFCDPFEIPFHWRRWFSLDFGFHCTCVLWFAEDPNTLCIYVYAEYYMEEHQTAQIHALNIKSRGKFIKGLCDPSGGGRQNDGRLLKELFEAEGLTLHEADNSWMPGVVRVSNMLQNGKLKIFTTCENTKTEYRLYRFDTKNPNEPARNQKDHAMDNLRYGTSDNYDYVADVPEDPRYKDYDATTYKRRFDPLTGA